VAYASGVDSDILVYQQGSIGPGVTQGFRFKRYDGMDANKFLPL